MLPTVLQQRILSMVSSPKDSENDTLSTMKNDSDINNWPNCSAYLESIGNDFTSLYASPTDLWALKPVPDSPKYFVRHSFLGAQYAAEVLQEASSLSSKLKPAGMGRGLENWHRKSSRGDSMLWLDTKNVSSGISELLSRIDCMVHNLSKSYPDLKLTGVNSVQLAKFVSVIIVLHF